jgi:uncharacterized membrane protein
VEGICEGVEMAGRKLGAEFPRSEDDENELPDQMSLG